MKIEWHDGTVLLVLSLGCMASSDDVAQRRFARTVKRLEDARTNQTLVRTINELIQRRDGVIAEGVTGADGF